MKFKDLKFRKNVMGGVGATHTFDNGITISIQASENHYCYPKENLESEDDYVSFEVAITDSDGDWITQKYIDDANESIAGWEARDGIEDAMQLIIEDDEDDDLLTQALTYALDNEFITISQAFEIIRNIK
jgi:hypothetical protein